MLSDDDSRLLECGVSMGVLLQAIARQYGQAKPHIDIQKVQANSVPFKSESWVSRVLTLFLTHLTVPQETSAAARRYNWDLLLPELAVYGVQVDSDTKDLIIAQGTT